MQGFDINLSPSLSFLNVKERPSGQIESFFFLDEKRQHTTLCRKKCKGVFMVTSTIAKSAGWRNSNGNDLDLEMEKTSGKVQLTSLSELTGFPIDFLKKELVMTDDEISVQELRNRVANFLDSTLSGQS